LQKLNSKCCFENGIERIIAVASPYRQKRVHLALKESYPNLKALNSPPKTTFEDEIELFRNKNEDFIVLLLGELERIKIYPPKGFIAYEKIPFDVQESYEAIKQILS
jgi:hypothetical protein